MVAVVMLVTGSSKNKEVTLIDILHLKQAPIHKPNNGSSIWMLLCMGVVVGLLWIATYCAGYTAGYDEGVQIRIGSDD